MRREGRQHGMVRTYGILPGPWGPRANSRFINKLDSPPTAGLFTRVQPKPTNHSKFTGKCGKPRCSECHLHPCSKSRDKAKGSQKLRSNDVLSNFRLVPWRGMDHHRPGLNFTGFSATGILNHLSAIDHLDDEIDDGVDDDDDEVLQDDFITSSESSSPGTDAVAGIDEIQEIGENGEENEDDDDHMSFCEVGFLLDQIEEDEGWCLVADT